MTTSATTDPWATNDYDPLSNTEHNPAPHPKTLTVKSISGAVIAEYPDFTPGTPVRVLPPIISNASPTTGRIVEDNWSFAGPTVTPNTPPSATTATASPSPLNAAASNSGPRSNAAQPDSPTRIRKDTRAPGARGEG